VANYAGAVAVHVWAAVPRPHGEMVRPTLRAKPERGLVMIL
jgi:hypothetical protein